MTEHELISLLIGLDKGYSPIFMASVLGISTYTAKKLSNSGILEWYRRDYNKEYLLAGGAIEDLDRKSYKELKQILANAG